MKGSILLISLILLLIMTVVVTSLAVRVQYSTAMTMGSISYTESLVKVNTAQLSYLREQASKHGQSSLVTTGLNVVSFSYYDSEHQLGFLGESACKRTNAASATQTFSCRHLQLVSGTNFGKSELGRLDISSVVEQPVLNLSGGN
ncbi:hypothetical protein [Paraferrimonas sp. SM1919]|uniref:hypothetical protein n=1 Tax=Paraferrimonas sp. SM1919 TaxID=2662263 RepID=UPI0013D00A6F|nr:hypothetical protein [Paraferrimonas sp. SM1919]